MQRRSKTPFILTAMGLLPAFWPIGPALAQPVNRSARTMTPYDARAVIAPALPVPLVPSTGPPSVFLTAARNAVVAGRSGAAQEALERAETQLLDRTVPAAAAALPDNQPAVLAIGAARRALAAHDRQGAIAAIDDALAATERRPSPVATATPPAVMMAPAAPPTPPPPPPVITRVLLPGHWALLGAAYVWVPPETTPRRVQSAALVPGAYLWRNGAYVWVPTHAAN